MPKIRKAQTGKKHADGEEKSLLLDGTLVPFLFFRKHVRNLNARIRWDGRLLVSAPYTCPYREVERFLQANAARLLTSLRKRDEQKRETTLAFENGERIPILGVPHTLILREGTPASACMEDGCLTVNCSQKAGKDGARTLLAAWLADVAKKEIGAICQEIYSEFFSDLFPYPTVRFRKMTASYGNCRKDKGIITFNLRLIYAPRDAIAYVVMHELVHMLHPDHSSRFYAALSARMPDHRERKRLLRDIPLRNDPFL